jgi:hypothetical protein
MLSLVANAAVPSGLTPSVARHLRAGRFPYVVPAQPLAQEATTEAAA